MKDIGLQKDCRHSHYEKLRKNGMCQNSASVCLLRSFPRFPVFVREHTHFASVIPAEPDCFAATARQCSWCEWLSGELLHYVDVALPQQWGVGGERVRMAVARRGWKASTRVG